MHGLQSLQTGRGEGMKPKLIKRNGIWLCALVSALRGFVGLGYTPADAYKDWEQGACRD